MTKEVTMQSFDKLAAGLSRDRITDAVSSPIPSASLGHRRLQRFFWAVLGAAAAVSISGNAAHAVLLDPVHPAIAVAVAVVPPIVLLSAVHGAAVLARTHASARLVHVLATGMTVLIAIAAFRLSFTALRALAELAGIPTDEAWLWPLLVEGSTTQATVALLAVAHSRTRAHEPAQPDADLEPAETDVHATPSRSDLTNVPGEVDSAARAVSTQQDHWITVAQLLCARDPNRRRDPAEIARILVRHHEDGLSPTEIAHEVRRSRSTISRIISTAEWLAEAHGLPVSKPIRRPSGQHALGARAA